MADVRFLNPREIIFLRMFSLPTGFFWHPLLSKSSVFFDYLFSIFQSINGAFFACECDLLFVVFTSHAFSCLICQRSCLICRSSTLMFRLLVSSAGFHISLPILALEWIPRMIGEAVAVFGSMAAVEQAAPNKLAWETCFKNLIYGTT